MLVLFLATRTKCLMRIAFVKEHKQATLDIRDEGRSLCATSIYKLNKSTCHTVSGIIVAYIFTKMVINTKNKVGKTLQCTCISWLIGVFMQASKETVCTVHTSQLETVERKWRGVRITRDTFVIVLLSSAKTVKNKSECYCHLKKKTISNRATLFITLCQATLQRGRQ